MTSLDYAVVALYLVLVAGIGVWAKGLIHGLEDYFVAGRKAPWWVAAISHHISGYSAFVFVGYAAVAYSVGFNIWTLTALPCFLARASGPSSGLPAGLGSRCSHPWSIWKGGLTTSSGSSWPEAGYS